MWIGFFSDGFSSNGGVAGHLPFAPAFLEISLIEKEFFCKTGSFKG